MAEFCVKDNVIIMFKIIIFSIATNKDLIKEIKNILSFVVLKVARRRPSRKNE